MFILNDIKYLGISFSLVLLQYVALYANFGIDI